MAGAATRGDRAAGSDTPARRPEEGGCSSVFAVLAHTAGRFDGIDRARMLVVGAPGLTGIAAIARSAIAVIVRLGFTPGWPE